MTYRKIFQVLLIAVLAGACGDDAGQDMTGPPDVIRADAPPPAGCDIKDLQRDANSWFPNGPKQLAGDLLKAIVANCGDAVAVTRRAWEVLELMETTLAAGTGGGATLGYQVVAGRSNTSAGLLDCVQSATCAPSTVGLLPAIQPALAFAGTFAVRGVDGFGAPDNASGPAVARDAVPFDGNAALWGVEIPAGSTWGEVVYNDATRHVLLYGSPNSNAAQTQEATIADVDYDFDYFPDEGPFHGQVDVGVCFDEPVASQHPGEQSRIQRSPSSGGLLLLEPHDPTFCPEGFGLAGVGGIFAMVRDLFAPTPLWAAVGHPIEREGGSAGDFSNFVPVEVVNTDGTLQILQNPPAVVQTGASFSLEIQALTGALGADGITPVERVPVNVYVSNNSGTPGGAVFAQAGDDTIGGLTISYTRESSANGNFGAVVISGALPKAGGYILCARVPNGAIEGFSFTEACTPQFQVTGPDIGD